MELIVVHTKNISTPLGPMVATADDQGLVSLRFGTTSLSQTNPILEQLEAELQAYFAGSLQTFKTPLKFNGTPFQNQVWEKLQQIPFGQTCSYQDIAQAIGKPTAFRAVALANRANPFAIIVPCHRVIKANGDLCGYNGGIEIKKWLLDHDQNYRSQERITPTPTVNA